MIKRTIEIAQQPVHLTVRNEQFLLLGKDDRPKRPPVAPPGLLSSIPCEDLGVVLVEHAGTTYSHAALERLLHHGAVLIVCGRDHLPAGMLLPLSGHTELVRRIHGQIHMKKPLRKRLWKQLVRAKIRAQAANLPHGSTARSRLLWMARRVRSGDPANDEAQAARIYWEAFRNAMEDPDFRRDPDGQPPNNLLNYGYAVVRAAVARVIVAAGLLPALGLHHHNRSNAFCLADDLFEPLRPIVDACVLELVRAGHSELGAEARRALLELLTATVRTGDQSGPLMVAVHHFIASFVRCMEGTLKELEIPVTCAMQCDALRRSEAPDESPTVRGE